MQMPKWNKKAFQQLLEIKKILENHFRDVQDIEFTIERGKLYMLQTRNGKRTGFAAVRIACDMVKEKLIDELTAVRRIPAGDLTQLLLPSFDPAKKKTAEVLTDRLAGLARARPSELGVHSPEAVERTQCRRSACCWSARKPTPKTSKGCIWRPAFSPAPAA